MKKQWKESKIFIKACTYFEKRGNKYSEVSIQALNMKLCFCNWGFRFIYRILWKMGFFHISFHIQTCGNSNPKTNPDPVN